MDWLDKLEKGDLPSILLIEEEDGFYTRQAVQILKRRILRKGLEAFNFSRVSATTIPVAELEGLIIALPAFCEKRLCIIEDLESAKAPFLEALLPRILDPVATTCLVLLAQKKIDERTKFGKELRKSSQVISIDRPKAQQMPQLAQELARKHGKSLSHDAALDLADMLGTDLPRLDAELEKLATYVGDRSNIALSDVDAVCQSLRQAPMYELTDAIEKGEGIKAYAALNSLLEAQTSPLAILAMLVRQSRDILHARYLMKKGISAETIGSVIKIYPPWKAQKFFAAIKQMSGRTALEAFKALGQLDVSFKSTSIDMEFALYRYLAIWFPAKAQAKPRPPWQ